MSIYDAKPISLEKVKTYPLASRPSKVTIQDFAKPITEESSLRDYLSSLPNILAVQNLRELAARMGQARDLKKPIIWGLGGHVIKTGLAPIIIDLMKRGFVTAIAGNGSVLVHDAEIAMVGSTSEDVDATLGEGIFGGADETGKLLNDAARNGASEGLGWARALAARCRKLNRDMLNILCFAPLTKTESRSRRSSRSAETLLTFIRALTAARWARHRIQTFVCWLKWFGK